MPVSKRKEDKKRPYRVDYFDVAEMKADRVLVRSKVVRAVTADEAKLTVMETLDADGFVRIPIQVPDRYIIRAYRFYKKISAEPKKKIYFSLDKLVSAKRAIEIMTEIENPKKPIVIRPEDLKLPPKFGDSMPATVVMTVDDPTTLPPDHPDHVCTDKCYNLVVVAPKISPPDPGIEFKQVFAETDMDTSNVATGRPAPMPEPCKWHGAKYVDAAGRCTALDSGSAYPADGGYQRTLSIERTVAQYVKAEPVVLEKKEYVTSVTEERTAWGGPVEHYAAGEQALTFPNKPLVPTQTAVFDDTGLDIDKAAPVLHPVGEILPPVAEDRKQCDCPVCDPPYVGSEEYPAAEAVEDIVQRSKKGAYIALTAALAAIAGLVYVYFHYFAR